MRRARMWSYLAWQSRDFVVERGAPLLIVATLMTFPIIMTLRDLGDDAASPMQAAISARYGIVQLFAEFSLICVLIGINGVVSSDRVKGYYRFLFAKPVSIPRYYAQAYVVNGVGLVATALAVLGAIYALGYPVFPARVLLMVVLVYLSLGGLGFFYSTLARFDWVLMGATWGLAQVLRAVYPANESRAGRVLDVILPPFHQLREVAVQLARGEPAESRTLAWLLAWGISGLVLGLLILRRRPLAT
ncbi:MAG TPA: hypothetical protein VJ802_09355 [Gemmatimonadaceae bacterium]|nr:hypothetical protein [Gemmatimonadaceae bacterium]